MFTLILQLRLNFLTSQLSDLFSMRVQAHNRLYFCVIFCAASSKTAQNNFWRTMPLPNTAFFERLLLQPQLQ